MTNRMVSEVHRALKKYPGIALVAWVGLLFGAARPLHAQTNPTPQALPYAQAFGALAHSSTAYTAGWQGWSIGIPSANYSTAGPEADAALIGSGDAATTLGNVLNYNGKLGYLNTAGVDRALCLAVNTTGRSTVQVTYDIATIRNPHNGTTNTRINEVGLQYRVGHTGIWTTLAGNAYQNNTILQIGTGVTTPQNLQSRTATLPSACDNKAEVQLRWVSRQVSGAGARPSFAVDNINVNGPCLPLTAFPACTSWSSPTPTTGFNFFNTQFGGAPCDLGSGCASNEITGFQIRAGEAYSMDNIQQGGTYTFSACNGVGGTAWPISYTILAPSGAVDAFGLDPCSICALTWTASESGTYRIVVTEDGACGSSTNTGTDNGFPAITCEGGTTCGACSVWSAPSPTAAYTNFNISFGGAPCSQGMIAPVNEVTAIQIWAGEAYSMDNIAAGGEYTFSACNGVGGSAWPISYTIVAPSGVIDAFGLNAGSSCALTWTASQSGTYKIVVTQAGACGSANTIDNGFPSITCTPSAATACISVQFRGGNGRGENTVGYVNTPMASSAFRGGDGRGEISASYMNAAPASSIFRGGNGRGEISANYMIAPLASSIFSGGNGRGEISANYMIAPLASSIFRGGNGRGDVSAVFDPASIPSNDAVCNAIPLAVGVNGPFSNVNTTVQPGEATPPQSFSCTDQLNWCSPPDQTVWFRFTAPPSGRISLNFGSTQTWDSEIALWSASACGDLLTGGATLIAANDDLPGSPSYAAGITPVCVIPGSTYFVQVDGYASTTNAAFELVLVQEPGIGSACDDGDPMTVDDVIQASCVCQGVAPSAHAVINVLLEGPYETSTGLMRDDLRVAGLIPSTEPYSALGYTFVNGGGGEVLNASLLTATGSTALVDWVVLELRSSSDPTTVVASMAALMRRNGSIVTSTGITSINFGVSSGLYHVAVQHRNHLAVMTMAPISLSSITPVVNLTDGSTATYGTDAQKIQAGAYLLWAGDVTFDGTMKYTGQSNDRDPILSAIGGAVPTNTITSYHTSDVNMDGTVKYTGVGNDRDIILQNIGGVIPTNVREAQVP